MVSHRIAAIAFLIITAGTSFAVLAQGRQDPASLLTAQREALAPLADMDGGMSCA